MEQTALAEADPALLTPGIEGDSMSAMRGSRDTSNQGLLRARLAPIGK